MAIPHSQTESSPGFEILGTEQGCHEHGDGGWRVFKEEDRVPAL